MQGFAVTVTAHWGGERGPRALSSGAGTLHSLAWRERGMAGLGFLRDSGIWVLAGKSGILCIDYRAGERNERVRCLVLCWGLLYIGSYFILCSCCEMGVPILQIRKLGPERDTHRQAGSSTVRISPSSMWLQSLPFIRPPATDRGRTSPSARRRRSPFGCL